MIQREIEKSIIKLSKEYPVIAITGPRQSGKTTLAKYLFKNKPYVSLENPDLRELANEDPRGFLDKYKNGAVFDEVQRTPHLFSYLQQIVDDNPKPGAFILTGSQQFGLMSGITQSLAGRIALVQLLPFSIKECYSKDIVKQKIDDVLYNGLYPPIHDKKLTPSTWYANYVNTYIERDVRQILNIHNLNTFQRFIKLCAGRIGQLVNLSDLANDCSISHNTAREWISILETSYIVFLLQPFYKNFNKRIIKTSKIYFYDTGLASWLLTIQNSKQLNTHPMRGSLFENFIISEMIKSRFNKALPHLLYFWRDRTGNEIDVVIEHGEKIIPIEIKSGKTINNDYFKGLKKWKQLSENAPITSYLIYGGNESLKYLDTQVFGWNDMKWINSL